MLAVVEEGPLCETYIFTHNRSSLPKLPSSADISKYRSEALHEQGSATVTTDTLHGTREKVTKASQSLNVPAPTVPYDLCSVWRERIPNPQISFSCNHTYCKDCFDLQVGTVLALRIKPPLLCAHPGCKELIDLSIIQKHMSGPELDVLLKISFNHYIGKAAEYKPCDTPDCDFSYLDPQAQNNIDGDPDSGIDGDARVMTCPECLRQICTGCHAEPRVRISCADNGDEGVSNKLLTEAYWGMANTKACPKCNAPMEKDEDCNHVQYPVCEEHMCWKCMKIFKDSQDCYRHMMEVHASLYV
ncbi:hypothetical protein DPSP01_013189 [Paraphaeosphaeria sporulosa]